MFCPIHSRSAADNGRHLEQDGGAAGHAWPDDDCLRTVLPCYHGLTRSDSHAYGPVCEEEQTHCITQAGALKSSEYGPLMSFSYLQTNPLPVRASVVSWPYLQTKTVHKNRQMGSKRGLYRSGKNS